MKELNFFCAAVQLLETSMVSVCMSALALNIIDSVKELPIPQRMYIAERIIHSVRQESQTLSMERAAELAAEDYSGDAELTIFTQLDSGDFYEAKS